MKTAIIVPCWMPNKDRLERQRKWLTFMRTLKGHLNFETIRMYDNASPQKYVDALKAEFGDFIHVTQFEEFAEYNVNARDYAPLWRVWATAMQDCKTTFDKLIFLDTDAYLLTKRICNWMNGLFSGWATLWCPRHKFPESSIFVICKDNFDKARMFFELPQEARSKEVLENQIPWTNVCHDFIGDRYGEIYQGQLRSMDYYCQAKNRTALVFEAMLEAEKIPNKLPVMKLPDVKDIILYSTVGHGDGVIVNAFCNALHRHFPQAKIHGFTTLGAMVILRWTPHCHTFTPATSLPDPTQYDLVIEACPELRIWGKRAPKNDNITAGFHMGDAQSIVDVYQKLDVWSQCEFYSRRLGFPVSITDAIIPTESPQIDDAYGKYVTISGGYLRYSHPKSWRAEKWHQVADWLTHHGYKVFQVGVPAETRIAGTIPAVQLPLQQQLGLVKGAALHLGSDGFFMHAAAAMSVPRVCLWSHTPSEVWGYRDSINIVSPKYVLLWRNPDMLDIKRTQPIMDAITVDMVITALESVIGNLQPKQTKITTTFTNKNSEITQEAALCQN